MLCGVVDSKNLIDDSGRLLSQHTYFISIFDGFYTDVLLVRQQIIELAERGRAVDDLHKTNYDPTRSANNLCMLLAGNCDNLIC